MSAPRAEQGGAATLTPLLRPASRGRSPRGSAAGGTPPVLAAVDVHQHLWPDAFLGALARRREPPLIRRRGSDWVLRIAGEPEWPIDLATHDPAHRAAEEARAGVTRAIIAPSCPLGVERLPAAEAEALLDAYHAGLRDLPAPLGAWAAAGLREPDPDALASRLAEGRVGLCLPAGAIADARGVDRVAPLLEVLEQTDRPLFVHPGPGLDPAPRAEPGAPSWWPALVPYVAWQHAAWWAHRTWLRPAFPRLRACFAMLAGLAPLGAGRLALRGGDPTPDPLTYLDTSSYEPELAEAVARAVGEERLVFGSDRPVVEAPAPTDADRRRTPNARRLLSVEEVCA